MLMMLLSTVLAGLLSGIPGVQAQGVMGRRAGIPEKTQTGGVADPSGSRGLKINAHEYFEMPGLNVMVFYDIYPEGHQGGVGIIQNGTRVATNGDLRLEPTPGQWQPIPKVGKRTVVSDREIAVRCWYPDSAINRRGFNPVIYPDLSFVYSVRVVAEGSKFRVFVDLDQPLPAEWEKQVGFNLELFPGLLFGKSWYLDDTHGLFNLQPNGPVAKDLHGAWQAVPMATGRKLTIAPEEPGQLMRIESFGQPIQLLDGRFYHNNGWYVVRSLVTPGRTKGAIEWLVDAHVLPNFISDPVVHVSQVGYHPEQEKKAVLEMDGSVEEAMPLSLIRYEPSGDQVTVKEEVPEKWGKYLRFNYFRMDFSEVKAEGVYRVKYGNRLTEPFRIGASVYDRDVWQPTLEYYLPVQMCHMRINEGYRVWHDLCHMDDALMAPVDTNHFDGYLQGPSTLTKFKPYEQVPGLDVGGWHDAGDFDLRVESQAGTVWVLTMAYEQFRPSWDQTTIDQQARVVEIHRPDGKDDFLQQIEHGLLSILGGYENLGRLYRGIICNHLRQYVMLGDAAAMTDGLKYSPLLKEGEKTGSESWKGDDRWVFTEVNPGRELEVARALAAASRVMKGYDDGLSARALKAAEEIYAVVIGGEPGSAAVLKSAAGAGKEAPRRGARRSGVSAPSASGSGPVAAGQATLNSGGQASANAANPRFFSGRVRASVELLLATGEEKYRREITGLLSEQLLKESDVTAHVGRVMPQLGDPALEALVLKAAGAYRVQVEQLQKENPFGVPYRPHIWGDGWNIQSFGVRQYFLQKYFPGIFDGRTMLNALNFILGNHPGENTSSFVSGVGSRSVTVAYGVNRADWSFIPGGSVSGTGIIRPDFPELKEWPYFWQQTEYVMGGGATNFLFLTLAAADQFRQE